MATQEPALAQTDPQAYYLWLKTQGMSPLQAAQQVQQRFGAPKTPQQQQEAAANNQMKQTLAQTGGMVGGVIAGKFIFDKASGWIDKLTGAKVSEEVVKNAAKQTGQSLSGTAEIATEATGATTQGASEFSKYFTPVNPGSVPAGQVPEGMTAIRSNIDGTVQVVPTSSLADQGFLNSVDWASVGQGAVGLLQAYQGYQSYKQGDYAGAGIYGAAGVGNLAAATGAVATGATAGTMGAYVIPGLNVLAGAYGGYQTAQAMGDMAAGAQRTRTGIIGGAASGAAIGSVFGPVGTGVGATIGATLGAIGSWTGSKKGKAQFMRDSIRGALQQGGILDQNFKGTLADGSTYDFGKDGSTLKWKEIDKLAAKQPGAWNATVPLTDALAAAYGFVGQKASDISAWYAKGAISNAGDDPNVAIKNAQHFAKQQGITFDQIKAKLDEAMKDNRINQSQYDYYLGGARQLTAGIKAGPAPRQAAPMPQQPAPQQQPEQPQGKQSIRSLLEKNMKQK